MSMDYCHNWYDYILFFKKDKKQHLHMCTYACINRKYVQVYILSSGYQLSFELVAYECVGQGLKFLYYLTCYKYMYHVSLLWF